MTDHKIQLIMSNESIIEDVKGILEDFNIKPTKTTKAVREGRKDQFAFSVCSQGDLKTFSSEIGFTHLKKERKLKILIQSYTSVQRRNTEFQNDVLRTLKANGEMNVFQIAGALGIKSVNGLRKELWRLEQKSKIKGEIRGRYRVYFWEPITSHLNQVEPPKHNRHH